MIIATTGIVQRLTILETGFACVYIGPAPTNVEAFSISKSNSDTPTDLAWKASMVGAIAAAMTSGRLVQVKHQDTGAEILAVTLGTPDA